MRVKKFILAAVCIQACIPMYLLPGCKEASGNEERKEIPVSEAVFATDVAAATILEKNFEYRIESAGKIRSVAELAYTCEKGGIVRTCNLVSGRQVVAGSLLLQFDESMILFRQNRARLKLFESKKEYESQMLGYENLLKEKTKAEADTIMQKLRISTGLAVAEQEIKEIQYELDNSTTRAPFTGMIADVKIRQGQQVQAGQEMFRIYDPNDLFLEVKVLEADISLLKYGTLAELRPLSDAATGYKGYVSEINPYVDENGLVTVKIKIKGAHAQIFPGMNCTAFIKIPFARSLVVPKDAVVMRSNRPVVFTLENGKAKWNFVTTGRENGSEVEIREGLQSGVRVITTNNLQLAHDAPVKEITSKME